MATNNCQCSDPGCPVQHGSTECGRDYAETLYRVDMLDLTGTDFCDDCGSDALDSGVFMLPNFDEDDDGYDDETDLLSDLGFFPGQEE